MTKLGVAHFNAFLLAHSFDTEMTTRLDAKIRPLSHLAPFPSFHHTCGEVDPGGTKLNEEGGQRREQSQGEKGR